METHRKPNVNPLRQVSSEFLAKKSISGISSPLSISTFKRYYRTIWFKKYNSLSLFTAIAKQPQQVSGGFPLGLQIRQHCLYKSLSQMDGVCPSPILKILIQKEPSFYLLLIFTSAQKTNYFEDCLQYEGILNTFLKFCCLN